MKKWKQTICAALCAWILTGVMIPGTAAAAAPEKAPAFTNPDGMTIQLVYVYEDAQGTLQIAETLDRVIIPAGTGSVTVEMQEKLLPEGLTLKDPQEIPLEADTLEVKIQVLDPTAKPEEPDEKPQEPTEKPTEPEEKPQEPTEKPTEPEQKPQPPAEKPARPQKPAGTPDSTNPQTGDSFFPELWIGTAVFSSLGLLILSFRKKR